VREQLQRAEQLLDDGHAAEALTRLRALDRIALRSPVLAGVREVLAVRALRETGRVSEADERARRYLSAHPGSAHVRELNAPNGGDR
jgi:predicted Zn-dependent protease